MAGLRIAAVTLIGLVPIAALVGQGGLGTFMLDGFNRDFQTPLTVGTVLVRRDRDHRRRAAAPGAATRHAVEPSDGAGLT